MMSETRTIDVTGLPGPVIDNLEQLVAGLRAAIPGGGSRLTEDEKSLEQRVAAWRAWVESYQYVTAVADDSRESIYEGR